MKGEPVGRPGAPSTLSLSLSLSLARARMLTFLLLAALILVGGFGTRLRPLVRTSLTELRRAAGPCLGHMC